MSFLLSCIGCGEEDAELISTLCIECGSGMCDSCVEEMETMADITSSEYDIRICPECSLGKL